MRITPPAHIMVPHPNAYLVGGSVRDLIRGATPQDYDIAVGQEPDSYAAKLAKRLQRRVIRLGKAPYTVHRIVSDAVQVDIVPMNGSSIEADLKARDFTINALACELNSGQIIDPTGGLEDIKHRWVRMASQQAFAADPIRLLRAFRMAAVMGYHIEPQTLEAISDNSTMIGKSAGERILDELHKIFACRDSHRQIVKMADCGLLFAIFPELIPLASCRQNGHHTSDVLGHTLNAYGKLEEILACPEAMLSRIAARSASELDRESMILLKLAILLHDIGKPDTHSVDDNGTIHFYGHAKKSAALARNICRRLRMSNRDREGLTFIVGHHQRPLDLYLSANKPSDEKKSKAFGRFFRQSGLRAPALLLHALADNMGKTDREASGTNAVHVFIIDLLSMYFGKVRRRQDHPLINGNDLIQCFGLRPSPLVGSILKQVEEAYLAGIIKDRDQALEWAARRIPSKRL